jgi:hypothetical protein
MRYITKKDSETGKKFLEVKKKMDEAQKAQRALALELGAKEWREGYFVRFGGISSLIFPDPEQVDKKVWKNVNKVKDEWMPRLTNKVGRAIHERIDNLPVVTSLDLNKCIGFNDKFKGIGVDFNNEEYISYITQPEWNAPVPEDCEEITYTRYNEMFGKVVAKKEEKEPADN